MMESSSFFHKQCTLNNTHVSPYTQTSARKAAAIYVNSPSLLPQLDPTIKKDNNYQVCNVFPLFSHFSFPFCNG